MGLSLVADTESHHKIRKVTRQVPDREIAPSRVVGFRSLVRRRDFREVDNTARPAAGPEEEVRAVEIDSRRRPQLAQTKLGTKPAAEGEEVAPYKPEQARQRKAMRSSLATV